MGMAGFVNFDEKFYKPMEAFLTTLNNECIALDEANTKQSVEVTFKVLDELMVKMKEANQLFAWLYNRLTHVGSYFDGLRVKEATEFDINVVLKLPLVYEKIKIKRDPEFPGFVKLNIKDAKYPEDKLKWHSKETEEIFKWINSNGELSHSKVYRWWESIFSKLEGLSTLTVNGTNFRITQLRKAGPAVTARISLDSYSIDVDLVPVIEFPDTIPPPHPIRREGGAWYIVPKPIVANEYVWRLSFPIQERALMDGKYHLKVINRFLKRFRDVVAWKPVASYYIKTIFLWEAAAQKDEWFFQKNLGFLLLYFLGKLQYHLEQGKLPFYWDKEMNLFSKMQPITMDNYANRIKKIRTEIDRNLKENKINELDELLTRCFNPEGNFKSKSQPTSNEGGSNMSLIDFDSSVDERSRSPNVPHALSSLPEPAPTPPDGTTVDQKAETEVPQVNQVTSSTDQVHPESSPVSSVDLDLETKKAWLEIEECKLRLRVAELDLETAKYNLKTAQKRYEMVNLQYDLLSKSPKTRVLCLT